LNTLIGFGEAPEARDPEMEVEAEVVDIME
jgi:hypothetical protein